MDTQTPPVRLINLDTVRLEGGAHEENDSVFCITELAAYVAGESWSCHPKCVSRFLAAFLRSWNDALDPDNRQRLKGYVYRIVGTAGDGRDTARAWMCVDWLARTQLPAWLKLAGLADHAAAVEALWPILSVDSALRGTPILAAAMLAAKKCAGDFAVFAAGDASCAMDESLSIGGQKTWRVGARVAARAGGLNSSYGQAAPIKALIESAFGLLERIL